MVEAYQLYSNQLGDWPLVAYYTVPWLFLFVIVEIALKSNIEDSYLEESNCTNNIDEGYDLENIDAEQKSDLNKTKIPNNYEKVETQGLENSKSWIRQIYLTYFISTKEEKDLKKRKSIVKEIICLINASFCSFFGAYLLWKNGLTWDQPSDKTEQFQVNFSQAYFVADSVYGVFYNVMPMDNKFHHLGVLIGLGASTTMGYFSNECVCSLFIAEFSNMFLGQRDLMKYQGNDTGTYFDIVGILFMISFLFMRIWSTIVLMPHLQADPQKPLVLNISAVILFWISWLWIFKVLNLAAKFFSENKPNWPFSKPFYSFMKFLRLTIPNMIYYTFVTWLTTRSFIRARFGIQWI